MAIYDLLGNERVPKTTAEALRSRDWRNVRDYFEGLPVEEKTAALEKLISILMRDGSLMIRFPDTEEKRKSDEFQQWLLEKAKRRNDEALFERAQYASQYAQTVEHLYQQCVRQSAGLVRNHDPLAVAWGCIMLAQKEFVLWFREAERSLKSDASRDRDPLSLKISPYIDSPERSFEHIAFSTDVTLAHELRLIGIEQGWMEGQLLLPGFQEPAEEEILKIRRNVAAIFDQIEKSDSQCRLFAGQIGRYSAPIPVPGKDTVVADLTEFSFPTDWQVALIAAGLRLQRRITQAIKRTSLTNAGFEENGRVTPRSPASLKEHMDWAVIQDITGIDLRTKDEKVRNLWLWEWLRGYSILREIAIQYLSSADDASVPCRLVRRELLALLVEHGMGMESAESFVENVTFANNSVDLHDCPLLKVGEDEYCLLMFIATVHSCARLVLSQSGRFRHRFQSKGNVLEDRLIHLLREHHVPCDRFKRKVDGTTLEIDCLVLWEGVLFVIECKNHALPSDQTRHQYDFCVDQIAARDQVCRKVEILKNQPELIGDVFGKDSRFEMIVPLVVNGPPFSLGEPIDGVYFTDLHSLETFFAGIIHQFEAHENRLADVPTSGKPIALWNGECPTVDDLIRFLGENPLFSLTSSIIKASLVPVSLGQQRLMLTTIIGVGYSIKDEILHQARKLFGNALFGQEIQ